MFKLNRLHLSGVAAVFEVWPPSARRYERIVHRYANDAEAIAQDWFAVGGDLRRAMDQVNDERKRD